MLIRLYSKAQIEDCRAFIKEHNPFGDEANKICADAMNWCGEHCSETLYANAEVSLTLHLLIPALNMIF